MLAGASIIALAVAGASGTALASDQYNALVNWSTEVSTVAAGSSSVSINNNQNNDNLDVSAPVTTILMGAPTSGTHDFNGLDSVTVDTLKVFSAGTLSTLASPNSISFWAATGSGASSAATIATIQSSENGSSVITSVSDSDIRASSSDLFAGSAQHVTNNLITADATGHDAANVISGDINPALSSTEGGFTGISGGPTLGNPSTGSMVGASATALIASVQELSIATSPSTSTVDNSRIGSLVLAIDTTTTVEDTAIDVTGNAINASITGNITDNTVNLDDALDPAHTSATTLNGSAGIASEQRIVNTGRTMEARVTASEIEAGLAAATPISNLTGSAIDFSGNDITASGTGNAASSLVRLGDGISQDGTFPFGAISVTRSSTVLVNGSGSDGNVNVIGDLYVASHQYNQLSVVAGVGDTAGDTDDGDLNVLVESAAGSTVDASGNGISALALDNSAANAIVVAGAATLDGLVSLGNGQVLSGGNASASTNGDLAVSVATLGSVTGDIAGSTVTVRGNSLSSEADGNVAANSIALDGTDVQSADVNPQFNFVQSTHTLPESRVASDFGLVSGQYAREADITASSTGSILVDAAAVSGAAGSSLSDAGVDVSGNGIGALSVANHVTDNSFTAGGDGSLASFDGTVGVISFQVAEGSDATNTDHLSMAATVKGTDDAGGGALVQIASSALATSGSQIHADGNKISARVFGNVVDTGANAIHIDAVAVSDGVPSPTDELSTPVATVYRSLTDAVIPNAAPDGLPDTVVQGGFALVNDQSVEDINADALASNPWRAAVTGDFVSVTAGSSAAGATVTGTEVGIDDNVVTGAITGNQAGSALSVTAESLNATSTLVNTQTFWNEAGGTSSASGGMDVAVSGRFLGAVSAGGTTIADLDAHIDGNSVLGSALVNGATNTVTVDAQQQIVLDVVTGNDVNSIEMGYATVGGFTAGNTLLRAETGLLNSQEFGDLTEMTVSVSNVGVALSVDDAGGSLTGSVVTANGNSVTAQALGNDASSGLSLNVGSFDLTDAGSATATNGPLGIVANHQRADAGDATISAELNSVGVTVSIAGVDNSATDTVVSADGNSLRALARVNNADNSLAVSGQVYQEAVAATPSVRVLDVASGIEMTTDDLAFGIASYQLNASDASSTSSGASVTVNAGTAPDRVAVIDGSALSASGNLMVVETRSNDAVNTATLDFGTNHVSGFVANLQQTGGDGISLSAQSTDGGITIQADDTPQALTDNSFDVSGNAIAAIVSANRATNQATASGTNLYSGTGLTTPSAVIAPAGASDVTVAADLSVVNVQGAESTASATPDVLSAKVDSTNVLILLDDLRSGSTAIDNNLLLAQATIHGALNEAVLNASADVGAAGEAASAAVVSRQLVASGSSATTTVSNIQMQTSALDVSNAGSESSAMNGNDLVSAAAGGTATNRLTVDAGAAVTGGTPAVTPVFGTASQTLNADFSVLNEQEGETDVSASTSITWLIAAIGSGSSAFGNNDSLSVDNNAIQASATGFSATNALTVDAGSSSDATGQAGNRQSVTVGASLSSTVTSARVQASMFGGSLNSGIEDSNNTVSATTTGNTALNTIEASAGASLQESSGAGGGIDPTTGITVTGADYAVLNWQSAAGATLSSTMTNGAVMVGNLGPQGVNDSTVSVEDNNVAATTVVNSAVNGIALNSGTFQHPSAAVSNLQTASGTSASASITNTFVGINGPISNTSSNSSFTLRGNSVGATTVGNSASNALSGGN